MKALPFAIAAGCVLFLLPLIAAAQQSIETLVMPGPVSRAHADSEKNCGACHSRLSSASQTQLCSACHKDVAKDVTSRTGFHGRIPSTGTAECRTCHTEHVGRAGNIVRLDRQLFDHSATDFALLGSHRSVPCGQCHAANQKFRDAADECAGCHAKQDVHEGRLGADCSSCHSDEGWRRVRFDHGATAFPLMGAHSAVACNACHLDRRYAGAPAACNGCHRVDDVHEGRRGPNCERCHSSSDWKKALFNHARDTSFRLDGKHSSTPCESCHKGDPYREKAKKECVACHRADDRHLGRNGEKCADCHAPTAWRDVKFDHERSTGYALHGKHADVACSACHLGPVKEVKLERACESCHRTDDPHGGQEGSACGQCHNDTGWKVGVPFAHDITRFPLLGQHVAVLCEECHLTPRYRDASSVCYDCHKRDDVHAGTLATRCEQCHSPAGWSLWRFDHDRETQFALLGAHRDLTCSACHKEPATDKVELAMECASCHQREDVHKGQFGPNCGRCHSATTFREVNVRR